MPVALCSRPVSSASGSNLSQAWRLLNYHWLPDRSSLECDGNSSTHHRPLVRLARQMACVLSWNSIIYRVLIHDNLRITGCEFITDWEGQFSEAALQCNPVCRFVNTFMFKSHQISDRLHLPHHFLKTFCHGSKHDRSLWEAEITMIHFSYSSNTLMNLRPRMNGVRTAWLCVTVHSVLTSNEDLLLGPFFFPVVDLSCLEANKYKGIAEQCLWLYSDKCEHLVTQIQWLTIKLQQSTKKNQSFFISFCCH